MDVTTNTYSFVGELTASTRKHYANNNTVAASPNLMIQTTNDYDHWGRVTAVKKKLNSAAEVTVSTMSYNPVGQLQSKVLGKDGTVTAGLQTINYVYNSRGWLSAMNAPLFSEKLWYEQSYNGSSGQWNGNISAQQWGCGTSGIYTNSYVYGYDKLGRLTSAVSNEGYNESGIIYDQVGNIKTLTRPKQSATALTYGYDGNQLKSVTGGYTKSDIAYNLNGSLSRDNELTVTYNELNLPSQVKSTTGTAVNSIYTYDGAGTKLQKTTSNETRYYIGGIEYVKNSATTTPTIDIIATEEGVIRNSAGTYTYEYFLRDHLGNMRVAFSKSGTTATQLQRYDYYAFGKEILRSSSTTNRYLYNGKELQAETGQYDYGARFYDVNIGRWMVVDPKAESMQSFSPYNFGFDNPIKFVDPDGMAPEDIVYFNRQGQETNRIKSNTEFRTFVQNSQGQYVEAAMPNIIKGAEDPKYQQYDYQIAASVKIYNMQKAEGTLNLVTDGNQPLSQTKINASPDADPTWIKLIGYNESQLGNGRSYDEKMDILQINNQKSNSADYDDYMANYGFSKYNMPTPQESINGGIKAIATKGFKTVSPKTISKHPGFLNPNTLPFWEKAAFNHNGYGDKNYMQKLYKGYNNTITPKPENYVQ